MGSLKGLNLELLLSRIFYCILNVGQIISAAAAFRIVLSLQVVTCFVFGFIFKKSITGILH